MHVIHCLLQAFAARLDPRARRVLLFGSALALAFFARTTVAAAHSGAYADAAAGGVMLAAAAALAATAWSAPRRGG